MRHFIRCVLLVALGLSVACAPGPEPADQTQGKDSVAKPEEKPVDPTSDVEKDQVNLDNLDKPLIEKDK